MHTSKLRTEMETISLSYHWTETQMIMCTILNSYHDALPERVGSMLLLSKCKLDDIIILILFFVRVFTTFCLPRKNHNAVDRAISNDNSKWSKSSKRSLSPSLSVRCRVVRCCVFNDSSPYLPILCCSHSLLNCHPCRVLDVLEPWWYKV